MMEEALDFSLDPATGCRIPNKPTPHSQLQLHLFGERTEQSIFKDLASAKKLPFLGQFLLMLAGTHLTLGSERMSLKSILCMTTQLPNLYNVGYMSMCEEITSQQGSV